MQQADDNNRVTVHDSFHPFLLFPTPSHPALYFFILPLNMGYCV